MKLRRCRQSLATSPARPPSALARFSIFSALVGLFAAFAHVSVSPAQAWVFTVNTTSDTSSLGAACFLPTEPCSLRQAIRLANRFRRYDNVITFALPFFLVAPTIRPTSPLPRITDDRLVIDASSQPLFHFVELDGSLAGRGAAGVRIAGVGDHVKGFVINRFAGAGVEFEGEGAGIISQSLIGVSVDGRSARGNFTGVYVQASARSTLIDNVISGNRGAGVVLSGSSAGNRVTGNRIGTDRLGTTAVPNGGGVLVEYGASGEISDNVISGNRHDGIFLFHTTCAPACLAPAVVIWGNYIGTDSSGVAALPNGGSGIVISDSWDQWVGGGRAGDRRSNVISGNRGHGIVIEGGSLRNTVSGNFIGTDVNLNPLGNGGDGILIRPDESGVPLDNIIGLHDPAAVPSNVIAFNAWNGIALSRETNAPPSDRRLPKRDAFAGNSIFSNGALGIDLGGDGPAPNDALDRDGGANELQNFPVVSSVTGGNIVDGLLESAPEQTYDVQLFVNAFCDPSGFGEGGRLVADLTVRTGADGSASFTAELEDELRGQQGITATATDQNGNTSEFSHCRRG
jgi:parallel beta-helix repeat protein